MPTMRPARVAGMAQHGALPGASGSGTRRALSNIVALGDWTPTRVKLYPRCVIRAVKSGHIFEGVVEGSLFRRP
eukprot:6428481-Prymnesium_polylepis.1